MSAGSDAASTVAPMLDPSATPSNRPPCDAVTNVLEHIREETRRDVAYMNLRERAWLVMGVTAMAAAFGGVMLLMALRADASTILTALATMAGLGGAVVCAADRAPAPPVLVSWLRAREVSRLERQLGSC